MKKRALRRLDDGLKVSKRIFNGLNTTIAIALLTTLLSGCDDRSTNSAEHAAFVRTEIVQLRDRQNSVTLTGEVQARFSADLSFRVTGRVLERFVDVGAHVSAGDVLARLDPTEQQSAPWRAYWPVASFDRVVVGGPAWHQLGADAWVQYSRRAS